MSGGSPPFRPSPGASFLWPDDFGRRFALYVDTEEEFDWTAPLSRDNRRVTAAAALPEAARRLCGLGASATYLVDHPIATDPSAIACLREVQTIPGSAIGTQLHPWVNPPFDEEVTGYNSFVGNLPPALEAAKLDVLTDAIARAFGEAPRTYRAGRYGVGPNTMRLLAERGYRIDTSIRARYDYSGEGGPDFRPVGNAAFDAGLGVLALPFSTVFTGAARRFGPRLHAAAAHFPKGQGVLSRTGLLSRVSLTPEGMPVRDALEAVRAALGDGERVLSFAFHSPSLVPGHTPYVCDASDLARFWAWWDAVLGLLAKSSVRCATQRDLVSAIDARLASGDAAAYPVPARGPVAQLVRAGRS